MIVISDLSWVAATAVLLLLSSAAFTEAGWLAAFIVAAVVATFALWQVFGLREARGALAAMAADP